MRRPLILSVCVAAVLCGCLLAALPPAQAVQSRTRSRSALAALRATPNVTAPVAAPAHNRTHNATVTPLRPAVECFSVDVCHSRCALAYNRTKPLVVKPVIPDEFDSDRSHLSCCESGCSRRTPSSLSACEDQCSRSPWIPDGAAPPSEFDTNQQTRGLEGRFPVYPTFLEVARRLSPRAGDSVQSEEEELGTRPAAPARRQRIMRFAANATAPAPAAAANATAGPRTNATRPSNASRPAAPRPVEYLINLVPEAPRAANKSSPNAPLTEEDELAAAMRGLMPERAHIPADILQYMEGQARLAASIAKTHNTVYVTKAEKLANLGEYHKQLCILGCRLRCKDPKPGPVPPVPRHNASNSTNTTAAKSVPARTPIPPAPAPAPAPATANSTAAKSSSVRQLLRMRMAAREQEEEAREEQEDGADTESQLQPQAQPQPQPDLSAFDEEQEAAPLSWDRPT